MLHDDSLLYGNGLRLSERLESLLGRECYSHCYSRVVHNRRRPHQRRTGARAASAQRALRCFPPSARPAPHRAPSTMTRSTGSVPEARISTRPWPPSSRVDRPAWPPRPADSACQSKPLGPAHVEQRLRETAPTARSRSARLPPLLAQRLQHLQRDDDAVAGGVLVQAEEVAGILAAQLPAALAQHFQHVAVADLGARERNVEPAERVLERQVGHQRADHARHRLPCAWRWRAIT